MTREREFQIKFIIGCFTVAAICGATYAYGPEFLSAAAGSFGILAAFLGAMAAVVPQDY